MAELDALISLAVVSKENNMVKPTVLPQGQEPYLVINQMRHPLLEKNQIEKFVSNDIEIRFKD